MQLEHNHEPLLTLMTSKYHLSSWMIDTQTVITLRLLGWAVPYRSPRRKTPDHGQMTKGPAMDKSLEGHQSSLCRRHTGPDSFGRDGTLAKRVSANTQPRLTK